MFETCSIMRLSFRLSTAISVTFIVLANRVLPRVPVCRHPAQLFDEAAAKLPGVDTLLFTHHMDPRAVCETIELVALRGFAAFRCPAHARLLRHETRGAMTGTNGRPGPCTCREQQSVRCWKCTRGCDSGESAECRWNRTWLDAHSIVC